MSSFQLRRRAFLELLGASAVGTVVGGRSLLQAQSPTPPQNVRIVTGGTRTLLAPKDLTHLGMWTLPNNANLSGSGAYSFAEGNLAYRYVSRVRRWLTSPRKGPYAGGIVELAEPATYGTDPTTAPVMQEVRGWASVFNPVPAEVAEGNGYVIGGIWWDAVQGVLWYTVYPYYSPNPYPVLGATRLNDDGTTTKYGMWTYNGLTTSSFKQVCKWIVPLPASAQTATGGRTMALGCDVVSIGASANWGPGLKAIQFPALTDSTTVLIARGLDLAAYTQDTGQPYPNFYCKREPDYDPSLALSTQFATPSGGSSGGTGSGTGYWPSSLDATGCYVWIETPTKQGVLVMGRRGRGYVWYGSPTEYLASKGVQDISSDMGGNGPHAQYYDPQLWIFDPEDLKAAAQGTKHPWDVTFKTRANWKTLFPNMPARDAGFWTPAGAVNASAYDPSVQQFAWLLPLTYNPADYTRNPTIQVFSIS
jgi:hypothetical protein